jgi:hypothetical protein
MKQRSVLRMLTTVSVFVFLFAGAARSAFAQQICGSNSSGPLGNVDQYVFGGDQWNGSFSSTYQCETITNSTAPPPSGPSMAYSGNPFDDTTGTPADYPDFTYGCFYGACTQNTQLPIQVSALSNYSITSGETVVEPSGASNDVAYDIWFNTGPTTPTNQNTTGTEMMIWVQRNGGVGPSNPITTFTSSGITWNVYTWTNTGNCNCSGTGSQVIDFINAAPSSDGPTTGTTFSLNLVPFFEEALALGQIQSSWYLTTIEFGTEIWVGGPGIEVNNFWVDVAPNSGGGNGGEAPYGGTPAAVPGTVLAEKYDTGGQGVGYSVSSTNGTDNGFRSDGVDLESTSAPGGGNDIGWTAGGQWFRYTVNVATAGTYTVTFEVASLNGATDGFHLSNSSGTNLTGSVNVPATGAWQTWTTVTASVTLPAGQQVLTLSQDNGGWNIDSFAFAATGGGGATLTTGTPYNIVNQNSGSCIGASGQATTNGTAVQQYVCANGTYSTQLSQQWIFTSAGSGYYEVADAGATGESWNVVNVGTTNGSLVQIWAYGDASNELWEPVSLGNGYYKFIGKGSGLCLDTPGASTANGVQLQIYTCNGTAAQAFKLVTP